ncbi:MAG: GNAT family N-acetyltransferase [Gammaproteobacteria bacterium]
MNADKDKRSAGGLAAIWTKIRGWKRLRAQRCPSYSTFAGIVLAAWFRAEWPEEVGADAEQAFQRSARKDEIPIGFVAIEESEPIGTVSILSISVHSHKHLEPWIGGLYVARERHHQGVASELIDAALDVASVLGIETIYVGIQAARTFYENRGWEYMEDGKAGGDTMMVLRKSLAGPPDRCGHSV